MIYNVFTFPSDNLEYECYCQYIFHLYVVSIIITTCIMIIDM